MASNYKLFYSPGACSMAVHAVLNALDIKAELIKTQIDGKANHTEEYLKYNPLGQVPVLVEDGNVLRESAAIMIHLLDKYKHALLPQDGNERIRAIQWLLFFNSSMHVTYSAFFLLGKNLKPEESAAAKDLIIRRINKLWRYVEGEITSGFIAGDQPTAADLIMAVLANWLPQVVIGPKAKNICGKVAKLPYFAKSLEIEGIKYRVEA